SDGTTGNFRPIDDIIEDASLKLETSGEADDAPVTRQDIIRFAALKCAKRAIRHICDVKEITPEIVVYRLSHPKVLEYLRGKIARLSSADALEVSRTVIRSLARDGLMEDGKEALLQAGRTRAACDLTSHYLSPDLRQSLISSYNFTHLDEYLKKINIEVLTTTVDKKSGKEPLFKHYIYACLSSTGITLVMSLNTKTYAEKAVQATLCEEITALSTSFKPFLHFPNALGLVSDNLIEQSAAFPSENQTMILDVAYTYPDRPPQLGPSRSPRRMYKHPQLPYHRPSHGKIQEQRAVSFPEERSRQTSAGYVSVMTGPESLRVVSLPSIATQSVTGSPTVTEVNSSLEYLETSVDTSYRSSRTGSVYLRIRNFPSDMPKTPSPPSSPESIFIIGDDPCLSKAFLSRDGRSPNSAYDTDDDAGDGSLGPALPRGLFQHYMGLCRYLMPVARRQCGAEGTIIEDADLPRMIWGLDLDDSYATSTHNTPSIHGAKAPPSTLDRRTMASASKSTFQGQVQPEPLLNPVCTPEIPALKVKVGPTTELKRVPTNLPGIQDSRADYARNQYVWNDAPILIHGLPKRSEHEYRTKGHPNSVLPSPTLGHHHQPSDLKSSAPAFVTNTSVYLPQAVLNSHPRIFVEPRPGSQITPERRLSAIEIAKRYRKEQQQNMLPTPPSSSSPLWSSKFSNHTPEQPQTQQLPEQYYTSRSFEALSRRDFAEELHQIEAAKRELSNIIGLPGVPSSDLHLNFNSPVNTTDSRTRIPGPISAHHDFDSYSVPPSVIDMSTILKQHSAVSRSKLSDSCETVRIPTEVSVTTPAILPQARNPPRQRLQSIPMARLIQRRLSSVVEEDVNDSSSKSDGSPPPTANSPSLEEHVPTTTSAGMTFSMNDELTVRKRQCGKAIFVKGTTGGASPLNGRIVKLKEDAEKENISITSKGTKIGKTTPRKKWRPRKKTTVTATS
ncbi:hypothetical protein H0H81_009189, partial [Sphagnurus paluster]